MLRYLKRFDKQPSSSRTIPQTNVPETPSDRATTQTSVRQPETPEGFASTQTVHDQQQNLNDNNIELPELPSDPGKRLRITDYPPNIRERVRRHYYLKGPCQPHLKNFPQSNFVGKMPRFNYLWFKEYSWLEYSVSKDAAFRLYCYLFKNELGHQGGGDTFVSEGFKDWKTKDKLRKHEGSVNSAHNQAFNKCKDLLNQKQHIETCFDKMSEAAKKDYRVRLNASIDCIRWLLKQGLAFRGHDESEQSSNQGNFLELLKFLADHDEEVRRVTLKNAPANLKLIAPLIQKDIVRACAFETTKAIIEEVGDGFFSILVDDSRDVSAKEQMAVVIRFVDINGYVVGRMLGVKHVQCTSALSLKNALVDFLNSHGLSISMMRGQGYDGASNIRGEFNGLKSLILRENKTAYYIHCFAHQLQLALVAVAKKHSRISELFLLISNVVNVVGGSCMRRDSLQEKQALKMIEALENEEIVSGRGLNQESTLIRPCETRWSSHYNTILSLIGLFTSITQVLDEVEKDGRLWAQRGEARRLVRDIQTFDFIFDLYLMKSIQGIANDLCVALQRKDQDIVNAMHLVAISKQRLQTMRENGWSCLVDDAADFCRKHKIEVPEIDDIYVGKKKRERSVEEMTNEHRYRVEVYNNVIDMQLVELNSRFNEVSTELLLCIACLNPSNSFEAFCKKKLVQLAEFYPNDFHDVELAALPDQLENFVIDMRTYADTSTLKGIGDIARKMVETRRDLAYPLVYRLIRLVLVLPVATATVERLFSAMNIVKNRHRNRMGDEWMNDNLIVYIEKEIFSHVSNEAIIDKFQSMANRRGQV